MVIVLVRSSVNPFVKPFVVNIRSVSITVQRLSPALIHIRAVVNREITGMAITVLVMFVIQSPQFTEMAAWSQPVLRQVTLILRVVTFLPRADTIALLLIAVESVILVNTITRGQRLSSDVRYLSPTHGAFIS